MSSNALNAATHSRRRDRGGFDRYPQPRQVATPSSAASWSQQRHGQWQRTTEERAEVEQALDRAEAAVLRKLRPLKSTAPDRTAERHANDHRTHDLTGRPSLPAIQPAEREAQPLPPPGKPQRRISRQAIERFLNSHQERASEGSVGGVVHEQREVLPRIGQRSRPPIDAHPEDGVSLAASGAAVPPHYDPYSHQSQRHRQLYQPHQQQPSPQPLDDYPPEGLLQSGGPQLQPRPPPPRQPAAPPKRRGAPRVPKGKDFRMQARIIRGAAITIQAWYRGHRARKALAAEQTAAVTIQSSFRGMAARREVDELRAAKRRAEVEQEVSQAIHLSHSIRQDLAGTTLRGDDQDVFGVTGEDDYTGGRGYNFFNSDPSAVNNDRAEAAAAPAPSVQKPRLQSRKPSYWALVDAATTIQAAWRGHLARKRLHGERRSNAQRRGSLYDSVNSAAIKIQAAFRGHTTRKTVYDGLLEQDDAARLIQRAWRKWARRRRVLLEHARILGEGVTDAQMKASIRDIAQRAVLIQVPDSVRPSVYGSAAFFHGTAVESVTIHYDAKTNGYVLQVVCTTIVDALRTHLALERVKEQASADEAATRAHDPQDPTWAGEVAGEATAAHHFPTPSAVVSDGAASSGKRGRRKTTLSSLVVSTFRGKKARRQRAAQAQLALEKPETPIPYPPGQGPSSGVSPFELMMSSQQAMNAAATAAALREKWEARVAQINANIASPAIASHAFVSDPAMATSDAVATSAPQGMPARETSSSPILAEPETVGKDGDGVHFVYLYVDVVSGFEPAFVDASTAVRLATKKETGAVEWSLLRQADKSSRYCVVQAFRDSAALVAHETRGHTLAWQKEVSKICTITSFDYIDSTKQLAKSSSNAVLFPIHVDVQGLVAHVVTFTTIEMYSKELTYLLMAFREDTLTSASAAINCVVMKEIGTSKNTFVCALSYRSLADFHSHSSRRANLCKRATTLTTEILKVNYANGIDSGVVNASDFELVDEPNSTASVAPLLTVAVKSTASPLVAESKEAKVPDSQSLPSADAQLCDSHEGVELPTDAVSVDGSDDPPVATANTVVAAELKIVSDSEDTGTIEAGVAGADDRADVGDITTSSAPDQAGKAEDLLSASAGVGSGLNHTGDDQDGSIDDAAQRAEVCVAEDAMTPSTAVAKAIHAPNAVEDVRIMCSYVSAESGIQCTRIAGQASMFCSAHLFPSQPGPESGQTATTVESFLSDAAAVDETNLVENVSTRANAKSEEFPGRQATGADDEVRDDPEESSTSGREEHSASKEAPVATDKVEAGPAPEDVIVEAEEDDRSAPQDLASGTDV
eukprot:CAMPEP_0206291734 /NCGR_PEP_ID=MMETSP0106_2-20121207/3270_1 /ASSEMBLY_ACC=CAM_ASM_000206 /TAXON_ID=81532 /ORGANISM="Acanthoeca-like sp., Strain 10tr" /LENGTH=1320 /DNA_ID=CAMNT_0053722299 /DNA_START=31 /DNA_END=3990 /DNA_ORIENTATION=-